MGKRYIMEKILNILACPKCKGDVDKKGMFVVCKKCSLAYPILSGVPNMLIDDAWELKKAEKSGFKHKQKL
jgi:uncharacterized protein YbaR (Trm112 family)